jgi:hypothetical protein
MTGLLAMLMLAEAQTSLPRIDWLEGHWLSCGEEQVSEHWRAEGGQLLGAGTTIARSGKVSGEKMRIGPSPAGLSFFAEPSGQSPAEFPLASSGKRRLVFENKAHDFPRSVHYWREGDTLRARIEGEVKGRIQAMEWTYRLVAEGTRCPAKG